jgi:hypothetical protein
MDFCNGQVPVSPNALPNLLKGHLIGVGTSFFRVERAKLAELVANVRVIDVLVAHVVGFVPVSALPHEVGKITHAREVRAFIEAHPILKREPLSF